MSLLVRSLRSSSAD